MRPTTALPRASICTFCSLRLPSARLALRAPHRAPTRALPRLTRAFTTTQHLRAAAAPPTNPYAATVRSLPALSASITERILTAPKPPSEDEVLAALAALRAHANHQLHTPLAAPPTGPAKFTPTLTKKPTPSLAPVSSLAYSLLAHPPVFLTPDILRAFVSLQSLTRDPSPLPAAFHLYANKPIIPASGRGAPKTPNPSQAKYAIPARVALQALETAIDAGDMTAALDVVDTAYGTPAFRRNKVICRALPFLTVATLAPGAIWVVAQQMAAWQDTVQHELAAQYAFGGLLAYVGLTGSIGMVALGTRNDQMVRVTWLRGTPLRERWVREEERAALDAVAMAWGFQNVNRRGEEEGEEWELLREVVGRKGMVLDEPTLMEGME